MEEQKHSGLGIASFVTSILSGVSIFVLVIVAGVMETSTPGGIDEESVTAIIVGFLLLLCIGASLVSLGLGIGGLLSKERKKIFAILGTIFSVAILISTLLIIMVGSSME